MNISYKNIRFRLLILAIVIFSQNQINADQITPTSKALLQGSILLTQELPLHAIISNSNYTTEEKLTLMQNALDNDDVDINAQDPSGKTALNLLVFKKSDPVLVQLLIDNKADVNKPDLFNVSPLHNAIEYEELEIAKMLLDAGADRDLKNDADEITPVDLARSEKTMALFGLET